MAKFYTLIFILFIVCLSACYENDPEPPSYTVLLAGTDDFGKTWGIAGIEVPLGSLNPKTCIADNLITYYPNGNYEVITGRDKCDPNETPALTGTWEMNVSETDIFIELGDSLQRWKIENLTETQQNISSDFPEGLRTYTLTSFQ